MQQRQVPRLADCAPRAVAEGGAGRLADRGGQEAGHHVHRRCLYGEQFVWCIDTSTPYYRINQKLVPMLCTKMCPLSMSVNNAHIESK